MSNPNRQIKTGQQRGYPLTALFLIITAAGITASLIGPAIRGVADGKVGTGDAVSAGMISGLTIMTLGAMVGFFHFHRGKGVLWGTVTGLTIGIFVGPMVVAPRAALSSMLGLSVGGTLVILLVTAAFRFAARGSTRLS